jgi:hypothetical protein
MHEAAGAARCGNIHGAIQSVCHGSSNIARAKASNPPEFKALAPDENIDAGRRVIFLCSPCNFLVDYSK